MHARVCCVCVCVCRIICHLLYALLYDVFTSIVIYCASLYLRIEFVVAQINS